MNDDSFNDLEQTLQRALQGTVDNISSENLNITPAPNDATDAASYAFVANNPGAFTLDGLIKATEIIYADWGQDWGRGIRGLEDLLLPCEEVHAHEWKAYVGFTESYDYCECGEKRGNDSK